MIRSEFYSSGEIVATASLRNGTLEVDGPAAADAYQLLSRRELLIATPTHNERITRDGDLTDRWVALVTSQATADWFDVAEWSGDPVDPLIREESENGRVI